MAYTNVLDETIPIDDAPAKDWPLLDRQTRLDIKERLESYFEDVDVDPLVAKVSNAPFARSFHTVTVALVDDLATFVAIIFDSVSFDDNSMHDVGNDTRLTVPAGFTDRMIRLDGQVTLTINTVGGNTLRYKIQIKKNGSTVLKTKSFSEDTQNVHSSNITLTITLIDKASATDFYEVEVSASGDTPDTVTGTAETSFEASIS